MVKLLSISNGEALQIGQRLRRSFSSLVAGCQAGSTVSLLNQTTRGRMVKSAKFVAKIVFVKFSLLQSAALLFSHTRDWKWKQKKALWSATTSFLKSVINGILISLYSPTLSTATVSNFLPPWLHQFIWNWATSSHKVPFRYGLNAKSSQERSKNKNPWSKDCSGKRIKRKSNMNTRSVTSLALSLLRVLRRPCCCIQTGIFLD